jgi:DegV family protein with EDD domain
MSVKIVTDSTCDLPDSVLAKYDITVIPMYINVESHGYLDGVELSRQEFYSRLPDWNPPPTTAAPGTERFRQAYEELADAGATQVLSIHISTSLSAVMNVAKVAAQETRAVPVKVFDSRQLSLGTGFLVRSAAKAAAEGYSMADILALMEDQISRTHVFAALDTLEYLRRSGRMNWAAASLGNLLRIKPILTMYEGNPGAERVRTEARAREWLVERLGELLPLEEVALVHTHAHEKAEALRNLAQNLLPEGEIPSVDITPVIGAHIGPGAAGFALISQQKT